MFSFVILDIIRCCSFIQGVISEEKEDSFNIPSYCFSPQELDVIVERNGCFSIEILETILPRILEHDALSIAKRRRSAPMMRAATEGLITQQFGDDILGGLFNLYQQKLEKQISIFESKKPVIVFVMLKRKAN